MISNDIDQLIGLHGANNPVIMDAMLVEYGASVYRLALSILHDPDDAQDAAQETFLRAATALNSYQVGTNFKAWLFTIAVNNCRMLLRKRSARQVLHQAWVSLTSITRRQPTMEAQVIQGETRNELWNLVESLDEKHRIVVVLRLANEMTISEISQVLGVNEKTVYTRLYDALARLRAQIQLRPELKHLEDEVRS